MNNISPISFTSRHLKYPKIPKAILEQCAEEGLTASQMAAVLDRPQYWIAAELKKYSIDTSIAKQRKQQVQDIIDWKQKFNRSTAEIAKIMNVSKKFVEKVLASSTYVRQVTPHEDTLLQQTLEKLNIPFDAVKKDLK